MANCCYIRGLLGVLKVFSIVLLLAAYSVGMFSYFNSEYNKSKMESSTKDNKAPNPTYNISSTIIPPFSSSSTSIASSTLPTTTSTGDEDVDKLPILWMERFHLIVTGSCLLFSIISIGIFLLKEDAMLHPNIRGIDFGYHFAGAILLIVSSVFMIYSAMEINDLSNEICSNDPDNCQIIKGKLSASGFSILSAVIFLAICLRSFGRKFYQSV